MKYINQKEMMNKLPHMLHWSDTALYSKHYKLPEASMISGGSHGETELKEDTDASGQHRVV